MPFHKILRSWSRWVARLKSAGNSSWYAFLALQPWISEEAAGWWFSKPLNGAFKLLSSAVLCGWWVGGKMPANISRWRKVMSSSRSRPLIIASWIVFVWYPFFFYNQYSMFDIFHLFCLTFVKLWDLYDHTMQGGFDPSSMCRSLGGWELELPPQWQSGVLEGLRGTIGGFCCPNPKNHLFLGLPPQRAPWSNHIREGTTLLRGEYPTGWGVSC